MQQRSGYVYGASAYLAWGLFPLFFSLLASVSAFEVVPWRVITALGFCLLVVAVTGAWGRLRSLVRSRAMLGWFALSSLLLYANWQIYVVGIVTGRVIETALGYFINPLVTIVIGVLFRKERLRRLQWIAAAVAAIGVTIAAIAYGEFPFIALGLALTFALYGAVRKHASADVDVVSGLTLETVFGSIFAFVQLLLLHLIFGPLQAFDHGPAVTLPLLLSGVVTAIPLMLFAAGTRRLPLSHMGFLQFITPIMNFIAGYFIFHEPMPFARWVGFLTVSVAVVLLIADMVQMLRAESKRNREPPPVIGSIP